MPLKSEERRHLRGASTRMYRVNGRIAVNPLSEKGAYYGQWNANPRIVAHLIELGLLIEAADGRISLTDEGKAELAAANGTAEVTVRQVA